MAKKQQILGNWYSNSLARLYSSTSFEENPRRDYYLPIHIGKSSGRLWSMDFVNVDIQPNWLCCREFQGMLTLMLTFFPWQFSFWKLKKCGSWCSLRLNLRFLEKSYTRCHGKVKKFLKNQRWQIEFKKKKWIHWNVHKIYYFCPFSLLLDTTLRTMCKLRIFHGENLTSLSSGYCCSSLLSS